MSKKTGFTVIEMLVVFSIIVFLASFLIFNFRTARGSLPRHQQASLIIADIRKAQALALSGANYNEVPVCGYGIHPDTANNRYLLYSRPPADGACNPLADKNYNIATDSVVEIKAFNNLSLTIAWDFDIYFELPNPVTYINDSTAADQTSVVDILQTGETGSCPGSVCTRITVYTSGKIDVEN